MTAGKPSEIQSLEEFEAMPKEEHLNYEFINGVVLMSPSPSRVHQLTGTKILLTVGPQLQASSCTPVYELDIKHHGCVYKPDVMIFATKKPSCQK